MHASSAVARCRAVTGSAPRLIDAHRGLDATRLAEEQPQAIGVVGTQGAEDAAAPPSLGEPGEPARLRPRPEGIASKNLTAPRRADPALSHQIERMLPRGKEAELVIDRRHPTGGRRALAHLGRLESMERRGFLAQDVRAAFEGRQHHRVVEIDRRHDADQLGPELVEHARPVGEAGDREGAGRGERPLWVGAGDAHQFESRMAPEAHALDGAPEPGADDRDSNPLHETSPRAV